jgi:hypothetical protein
MNLEPEQLVKEIKSRFDHATQKKLLREKYHSKMTFAHRGGMWKAGPELNNMIFTCGRSGEVVLPDLYDNPIQINTAELIALSQERWNEQMTAWHIEHEELAKQR